MIPFRALSVKRLWYRLSLVDRLTVAFVVTAAAVGVVAGLLFARQLQHGLEQTIDVGLRSRAETLAVELALNQPANTRLVTGTAGLSQLVDARGSVLQASAGAPTTSLLTGEQLARARTGTYIVSAERSLSLAAGQPVTAVEVRILARPAAGGEVLVLASAQDTAEAVRTATAELLVVGLVGLLLAALGARTLLVAVLRPVEQARARAELASQGAGPPTLPEPAGNDEFARLVRTLNRLLERQERLLEAERDFTANASHELRTPLAVLSAELELAARPSRTIDDLREMVVVAQEETARLVDLVQGLLTLARTEGSRAPTAPCSIAVVVDAAIDTLAMRATERRVTLLRRGGDGDTATVHSEFVELALSNLLRNALAVSPPGATVAVEVELSPRRLVLCVRDQGPGFAPEFLGHAFDRFTRSDASRSRESNAEGAGLGLAIVRSAVAAQGGEVFADNVEDGGAVVGFAIPQEA